MRTLVLLAGPNGAGKTTFINRFLRQRAEAFRLANPDEAPLFCRTEANVCFRKLVIDPINLILVCSDMV